MTLASNYLVIHDHIRVHVVGICKPHSPRFDVCSGQRARERQATTRYNRLRVNRCAYIISERLENTAVIRIAPRSVVATLQRYVMIVIGATTNIAQSRKRAIFGRKFYILLMILLNQSRQYNAARSNTMAQFFTNFDEYPVGDVTTSGQADWTPRISNGTSDYRIIDGGDSDGKFLRVTASGTNGSRVLGYNPLNGVGDNIETLVKFWVFKSGSDGSTGRYGAAYTRYGGNSEASTIGYAASFVPVSNVKSLALYEDSTGVVQYQNYAWSMSTDYFMRTRLSGTLRQVKIWPASDPEPSAWTFESNGTPPTIADPYSGVGTYQADSYLYVKQFSAATGGETAPKTLQELSLIHI